ncbi:MAG: hypothetical protein AAF412_05985 [Pseudomonadota bacterium]
MTEWLMSLSFITCICYISGWLCDRIIGFSGFGHVGNWLLIQLGAYGGMYVYNMHGYGLSWYPVQTLMVIFGSALITFVTLCTFKNMIYR